MPFKDLTGSSLQELVSLEGKVAVVTGGAMGIGEAVGRRFAEAGATVVLADIDETAAKETAESITEAGGIAHAAALDASNVGALTSLAQAVASEHGSVDIWVNNAGIYPFMPSIELSEEQWNKVIDLNLKGVFFGSQAAAKVMGATGGVIINLASTAGFTATPAAVHYSASKHGVRGITRTLAAEFGPMGIRVLALAPTLIETPGIASMQDTFEAMGQGPDAMEAMLAQMPAGRFGKPDDVARVALFCASDLSEFMTGSTLPVDGGTLVF